MSGDTMNMRLSTICVALLSITTFLAVVPAMAQSNNGDYLFLLASGFLCDPGDRATCPATVKSANGDSYEMSGAGILNIESKSVKAAGTFTHKSSHGDLLETGVWTASDLVSFDSYGIAPGALLQHGWAFGPETFGPKRLPRFFGPMPTGGLAVFRIRLLAMSGVSTNAVLQVNSALGDVPREHSVEGIRLSLEKNGTEFSLEVSGRVTFLRIRPEVSTPAKKPQQEPAPDSAETSRN